MINMPTEATIECDECGTEDIMDLFEMGGPDPMVAALKLPYGWGGDVNGETFCPECLAMDKGGDDDTGSEI